METDTEEVLLRAVSKAAGNLDEYQQLVYYKPSLSNSQSLVPRPSCGCEQIGTLVIEYGEGRQIAMVIIMGDDPTFVWWRENNQCGYILVTENPPSKTYLSLHKVGGCGNVKGDKPANGNNWTIANAKVCATDRAEIDEWAKTSFGADVIECGHCFKK